MWLNQKGPIVAEPVDAPLRKNEPRGTDLQTQIDELQRGLAGLATDAGIPQPTEERLAQITVQCARMVESWQQMEQRRSAA